MKRLATLLLLVAALQACGSPRLPRLGRGGGGGGTPSDEPRVEQPSTTAGSSGTPGARPGVVETSVGREAQPPSPPPPLGSARPPRAPQQGADVNLPPPTRRPEPAWLRAAAAEPEFRVDFAAAGRRVPSGLHAGLNDLLQANAGAWKVWGDGLPDKNAGLIRLWLRYHSGGLNDQHFRAAAEAAEAGLSAYITVVGFKEQAGRHEDNSQVLEPVKDSEIEAWAQRVKQDIATLRGRGVDVRYVEIWNEPDFSNNWGGTPESFARFFAKSGRRLRELLPEGMRIGGPSMGSGTGGGRRLFRLIAKSCVREGFEPDFLSWHQYGGMPTDQELMGIVDETRRIVMAAGLTVPELILSEWNMTMPPNLALEDHRAAANFVAMFIGMARTELRDAMYFFLQDGFWESKSDYDGGSLGMFSLHGAPKAVLAGVRLVRQAAALPMVPTTRLAAPNNLALMASREGRTGLVLATNAGGREEDTAAAFAEYLGVDLAQYKDKERALQKFLRGQADYASVGGPRGDESIWLGVRRFLELHRAEMAKGVRTVQVELGDAPSRIGRVWLLDETHGNPLRSQEIQRAFAPYKSGLQNVAVDRARTRLLADGVASGQIDTLIRGYRNDDQAALRSVPADVRDKAMKTFNEEQRRLELEVTPSLAAMADAFAAEVDAAGHASLQGGTLQLKLPVGTTLLVEVLWGG